MTTKIKWRLANRPTPKEVQDLFTTGLLNKDEAREILFSLENDEGRDKQSLQEEIKFLRATITQLASTKTQIIQTIKHVEKPYTGYPWFQPYVSWCSTVDQLQNTAQFGLSATSGSLNASLTTQGLLYASSNTDNALYSTSLAQQMEPEFNSIQTF